MYIGATAIGNPVGIYDDKMEVWNNFVSLTDEYNDQVDEQNLKSIGNIQFHGAH